MGRLKCLPVLFLLQICLFMTGCATNPVTGRNELMLVPEATEIKMGQENYLPARQMEGGDYVADPSVEVYVSQVGQKMVAVSDRKLPYEFKVVNSPEINAWMMPGGKMGINRGLLLKMDNEAELAAVIGHEITHAAAKHGAKQMQEAMLLQGSVLAASVLLNSSVKDGQLRGVGVVGAQTVSALLTSKFSRDDEREADHYGMVYMSRAGYDPQAAVSVQELLLKESKGKKDNMLSRLLAGHPPSAERVATNLSFSQELPAGGILGRDEYKQHLAHLRKSAPAYASYEAAKKAFKEGDFKKALALTDQAIVLEPKEALFYVVKGKAMEAMKMKGPAAEEYRQAVQLNPDYYEGHLSLGLLLDSQGKGTQARVALEKSASLLKTDAALRRLGGYALQEGNTLQAKDYFRQAAASGTDEGKAAFADLLRLDLPGNAATYLGTGLAADEKGQLLIIVQNNTPFPVGNTVVNIRSSKGSRNITLPGVIQPKSRSAFNTGENVTAQQLQSYAVGVISARLVQ